jgi:hypothetical protein
VTRFQHAYILALTLVINYRGWEASAAPRDAGPIASISPASLTFPTQQVGTTGYQFVCITNVGTSPLHVIDNPIFTP